MPENVNYEPSIFLSVFLGKDVGEFEALRQRWPEDPAIQSVLHFVSDLKEMEALGRSEFTVLFLSTHDFYDYAKLYRLCLQQYQSFSIVLLGGLNVENIPQEMWSEISLGIPLKWLTSETLRLFLRAAQQERDGADRQHRIQRVRALLAQSSGDHLWEWDCEAHQVKMYSGCERLLGYLPGDTGVMSFQEWLRLSHPEERTELQRLISRMLERGEQSFFHELRFLSKDGKRLWVQLRGLCVYGPARRPLRVIGTMSAIKRRMKTDQHVSLRAQHDLLTCLLHREAFMESLRRECQQGIQPENGCTLFLFDVDRFSKVNDTWGISTGDRLLRTLAQRLLKCTPRSLFLGRLGSDEFAVVFRGTGSVGESCLAAQDCLGHLNDPVDLGGFEYHPSISCGISYLHEQCSTADELLAAAHLALRQVKDESPGTYRVFDAEAQQRFRSRLQLEQDLWGASDRGELVLMYQPLVSLDKGDLKGFEVLLRWHHPERGMISPVEFIPLAEATGAIVKIGWWVLEQSCKQIAEWNRMRSREDILSLHVNFSSKQFATPALVERLSDLIRETGIDASWLKIEITESILMEDTKVAIDLLHQFRGLGVEICMDDFGTGYSSLSYLHQFPIDAIKIDRSFVRNMEEREGGRSIIHMILSLASHLKLGVIAEGIETARQHRLLWEDGCRMGQGYYFSRPLYEEDATSLVLSQRKNTAFSEQKSSLHRHLSDEIVALEIAS
ncbi:MAG: EAL domain-containing protein [Myxococcales bacterium]|nr:EAL domain-containing protein [Myxococcales bacterium]